MIKKYLIAIGVALAAFVILAGTALAGELDIAVESSDGYGCEVLLDDDYTTKDYYRTDTKLTVTADEKMSSVYIVWDTEPGEWILTVDGKDYTYGQDGFLHEFIELPKATDKIVVTIKEDRTYISDIYAFDNEVPGWVQKWEAPYDRADMLFISAHSDDEALFFGGVIPTYVDKGYRLQVAYMCEFYRTEPYRRHEQLNGLWTMGIDHYPQLGEFEDLYSESLDGAMAQQDIDEVTEYVVRTVRRFKPQVLISHDFDGEYGHGQHMLLAEATARALKVTADSNEYTDSAGKYGTWDVPKAYFHLYGENEIELDARIPLNSFGGKTCLEVAAEAYKKHESQQWMWFYVSDGYDEEGNPTDYECSCTKYGLYKTAVGNDTGNDLMENIIPYDEQTTPDDRNESTVDATGNEGEITAPGGQVETGSDGQQGTNNNNVPGKMSTVTKILIALGILFVIIVIVMVMLVILAKSKRRRREAVRRRRLAAQRKKRQQQWK